MTTSHPRTLASVAVFIGGGVVALMAGLYGLGALIDPVVILATERDLAAEPEHLAALIGSPEGVVEWWNHAGDMHGENRISERILLRAEGNTVSFVAGEQIFETWTLVESDASHAVWDIDFKSMVTQRTLSLAKSEVGTLFSWHEEGRVDNPVLRWTTLLPQQNVMSNFHSAMQIAESAAQSRAAAPEDVEAVVIPAG